MELSAIFHRPKLNWANALKQLVDDCQHRNIRVLLDAVFNHAGGQFAPFLDVQVHAEKSKYKDWFHVREWPLQINKNRQSYETIGFVADMPN